MSAVAAPFAPLLGALCLPESARVDRRVPKELLLEGAPAADRRAVTEGVGALAWLAVLKPHTVGVAAAADGTAPELVVIGVELREGARAERIVAHIHKAIPYPLLLIEAGATGQRASVAAKRPAAKGEPRLILEGPVWMGPAVEVGDGKLLRAEGPDALALEALALHAQPDADLGACYRGWGWTLMAWRAARINGIFRRPADEAAAAALVGLLERREALQAEAKQLDRELGRATQLRRQVELRLRQRELGEQLEFNRKEIGK